MSYIRGFIEAVCPEAPDLYLASSNEEKCLTDATELIRDLRLQVRVAEARIAELEQDARRPSA